MKKQIDTDYYPGCAKNIHRIVEKRITSPSTKLAKVIEDLEIIGNMNSIKYTEKDV